MNRFGTLADKHGPRLYLTLGPALIGAGALLSMGMTEQSDLWTFGVASLAVFSFGLAVLVAPIIPAINEHEIERILDAAKAAGAREAGYVLLRLPLGEIERRFGRV